MREYSDIEIAQYLTADFIPPELLESSADNGVDVSEAEELPKYITNYIGSKQKLIQWIWQNTPDTVKTVFDAFGGSNVVGYMYKRKGMKVISNDALRYSYHIARAIIENNSVHLTDDDIAQLIVPGKNGGDFISQNFKNTFFTNEVVGVLDSLRANIDDLKGYKKDIALAALGKTCISGKGGFGHFSSTTNYGTREHTRSDFLKLYESNLKRISDLVFDNGQEHKAYQGDITETAPQVKADLAYFDPPYATHFSTTNYETAYHFVEGLMTYWKGKEIKENSKTKTYEVSTKTITEKTALGFFGEFLTASKQIKYWIISYRDNAYPSERQIKGIIDELDKDSRMKSRDHHYSISAAHSENSDAKERIFICGPRGFQKQALAEVTPIQADNSTRLCHTSLTCEAKISTEAKAGDPRFTFILTHAGTNANGDHFTAEELEAKHTTVVGKKIDLKHSQDITDIVGGVITSRFSADEGGVVECVGELYVQDNPHASLAYKLLKKGIISQVSMECDYEEGECSVCGKRVKSRGDDCLHLKKYKGKDYQDQKVFEKLHNITFTGLGLLDRAGADANAKIISVASTEPVTANDKSNKDHTEARMSETKKLEKQDGDGPEDQSKQADLEAQIKEFQSSADEKDTRIKELESELEKLNKSLEDAQKQIETLTNEKMAARQRSKAEAVLKKWESMGRTFESEELREKELGRLAALSEEALKAVEVTIGTFEVVGKNSDKEVVIVPERKSQAHLNTRAANKPEPVDDSELSLKDELKNGFVAAYNSRIGE
ncbi:MAG: DNA adenine methylase [FCB group bacterium]|nr:DNA adenine methylase [FCB group bacterium]